MTQVKLKIVVFHDSIDKSELPRYSTKDNDTFIDVLHNVNIMPTQWRAYYRWIGHDFEFGHLYKDTTSGLHFVDPWGVNTGQIMKTTGNCIRSDKQLAAGFYTYGFVSVFET
jgi:hypothetical protein